MSFMMGKRDVYRKPCREVLLLVNWPGVVGSHAVVERNHITALRTAMSPTVGRKDVCRPYRTSMEKLDGREEKPGRLQVVY
jgi:hypothetical protein